MNPWLTQERQVRTLLPTLDFKPCRCQGQEQRIRDLCLDKRECKVVFSLCAA